MGQSPPSITRIRMSRHHISSIWKTTREFYWPGFIEKSLAVLEANPKCLLVQIRALDDTNGHAVEPHTYCDQGVEWRRILALEFRDQETWHGFSFDPGLRRLADYVSIQGYGIHTRFDPGRPGASESAVGEIYRAKTSTPRSWLTAMVPGKSGTSGMVDTY